MEPEISDSIKENELTDAAAAIIKSGHHHEDGSEVSITLFDEPGGIERKIIEDENAWRLKNREASQSPEVFAGNEEQKKIEPEERPKFPEQTKKQKTILAGCNCGQLFNATFSGSGTPSQSVKINAYDSGTDSGYSAAGEPAETYSARGPQTDAYSASGNTGVDYGNR